MKTIFYIFCLIFVASALTSFSDQIITYALASELTGRISTNPNDFHSQANEQKDIAQSIGNATSTNLIISKPSATTTQNIVELKNLLTQKAADKEIKVLGISRYTDNSLLRGTNKKIYMTQGQVKKLIINLTELKKYQGRKILDVTNEELTAYQTREHLDMDLIRKKHDVRVYVILQGRKKHILNLEELRTYFFGWEIFNISPDEMNKYQDY